MEQFGIMEQWNDGFEGVVTIYRVYFLLFSPIFQHSGFPFFHSDGTTRLPLRNI